MGGSTPKVKETQAEKSAALDAQARWNERRQDGYLDLEKDAIADASRDYTDLLQGRASADVARAEREAYSAMGGAPTAVRLGQIGDTINTATTLARNDASATALNMKDERMLTAIKRGNDVASDSSQLLDASAQLAGRRAVDTVQNKIIKDNATMQAAMQVAGAAVQGHTMKQEGYTFSLKDGYKDKKGKAYGYAPLLANLR